MCCLIVPHSPLSHVAVRCWVVLRTVGATTIIVRVGVGVADRYTRPSVAMYGRPAVGRPAWHVWLNVYSLVWDAADWCPRRAVGERNLPSDVARTALSAVCIA